MDPSTSLRFAQGSLAKAIDSGSLSVVEVCLIFSTCMKKWPLRRCSGILCLVYGPFDFTAFRSGILGLAYGPFDVAQGSWAKAIDSGSLSAVEVCLIFSTCMKKWPLRRCSGILGLAYGTFDFTAFRSGILGLAYGPFGITAFRSGILGESD